MDLLSTSACLQTPNTKRSIMEQFQFRFHSLSVSLLYKPASRLPPLGRPFHSSTLMQPLDASLYFLGLRVAFPEALRTHILRGFVPKDYTIRSSLAILSSRALFKEHNLSDHIRNSNCKEMDNKMNWGYVGRIFNQTTANSTIPKLFFGHT